MKTFLFFALTLCCYLPQLSAQTSFGLRLGMSPDCAPGSAYLIVNRNNPIHECIFNVERVQFSGHVGLVARVDRERFWFMAETLYGKTKEQYSFKYTYRSAEQARQTYTVQKTTLDVPLSAGVKFGLLEVFSGLVLSKDLVQKGDLKGMDNYAMSSPSFRFGWHSGIGVHVGAVMVDVRYQQSFANYGANQFVGDQELGLQSIADRVMISTGLFF